MKNFAFLIVLFSILIFACALLGAHFFLAKNYNLAALFLILMVFFAVRIIQKSTTLNKKMMRLFEAIQYQDFAITFKSDSDLGPSFKNLNQELNAVIKSFNQVRAEREATLHFVQAVVHQINVGIFSYGADGKIDIINQAATNLLSAYRLHNIATIKKLNPEIYDIISSLKSGESKLLKNNDQELSFSLTEILLRGRKLRLISIQNIKSELQLRELEAWQNLTKVLRHEIMNSVTPIVSLSETMEEIVGTDLQNLKGPEAEAVTDLKYALQTVKKRSKGIMNFVNAYREFTNIPKPNLQEVPVDLLFKNLQNIYKKHLDDTASPRLVFEMNQDFSVLIDQEQIEQVLLNLIKNAFEANYTANKPMITVRASLINNQKKIDVIDNGEGINEDQIEKIFVPFYTSKESGSGVGLSLSRQIMQNHGGNLSYHKNPTGGSIFRIELGG
jgi:two-component system, NtrC family, nitrogen regulation sensor histidine kinase NtrY